MKNKKEDEPLANLEAERQVLGLLLLQNEQYWRIAHLLKPEYFYVGAHKDIFNQIKTAVEQNEKADPVTLRSIITYEINYKPAVLYLLALTKDPTTIVNLVDYARTIVNLALRRDIIYGAQSLIEKAERVEITTPAIAVLEDAERIFSDIAQNIPEGFKDKTSIQSVCDESLVRLAELMASEISPYPSIGIKDVTRLMGPLTPGCVYVLAGGRDRARRPPLWPLQDP